MDWYKLRNQPTSVHKLSAGKCCLNFVKYSISIQPTLQSAYIFHIIGEAAAFREPPLKFSALQYARYILLLFVTRIISYSDNKMTAAPHTVSTSGSVFLKRDSPPICCSLKGHMLHLITCLKIFNYFNPHLKFVRLENVDSS